MLLQTVVHYVVACSFPSMKAHFYKTRLQFYMTVQLTYVDVSFPGTCVKVRAARENQWPAKLGVVQ